MTVAMTEHRVTRLPALTAQCDACPEALYLDTSASMPGDIVRYLTALGWTVTGPAFAITTAHCPTCKEES